MEHVFSTDPPIIVVEDEDDNIDDVVIFHVYAEGEHVGMAYTAQEAKELAQEVFAALTGEPQEEDGF